MAKKGRRPPPRSAGPRGGKQQMPAMPDMQSLMAQAAEMQAAMADKRAALADETFEGTSGGGVVRATVNGAGDVVSVEIDASVLDPDDPELVGDLVVAAVNQAMANMRDAAASAMGLGGLGDIDLGSMNLDDLGGLLG